MEKEKKEIWIEKLIELLNEYEKTLEPNLQIEWTEVWIKSTPEIVISKKFWFIKWLVEKDKISNDWIKPRTDLVKEIIIVDYKTGDAIWWKNKYTEVEQLIMYLSIQDEPIRFLCEIIK